MGMEWGWKEWKAMEDGVIHIELRLIRSPCFSHSIYD